jgi:hypothetical protein
METSSAVTRRTKANYKSSISPAQSRPFPQLPEKRDKREYARLLRNDAQVAVLVLNASKGKAHERLTIIRRELEELRAETSKLKTIEREIGAEMFPNGNDGPGRSGTKRHLALAAEYKALYDDLNKRHIELNDRLAFYAFRPCVAYTINSDEWRFGIVPDANRRVFQMKVGPFTATEGDAVMSMVRLDASGQLSQVRLCEQCKTVWTVARKIDRFCGKVCREAFYAADSDFLARKAKNQDDYRRREKQKAIDAIASLKNL